MIPGIIEQENTQRIFVNIAGGAMKLRTNDENNNKIITGIEGTLVGLFRKEVEVKKGQKGMYYYFNIDNGPSKFRLSCHENIAAGIIMSLITVENFTNNTIQIIARPSKDGEHTNTFINFNGVKLNWAAPRDQWAKGGDLTLMLGKYVNLLNNKIGGNAHIEAHSATPAAPVAPVAPVAPAAPAAAAPSAHQGYAAPAAPYVPEAPDFDSPFPGEEEFNDSPEHI